MAERSSTKILLWGIGTFLALSAIATVLAVPLMLNRPESIETGSTTTQLPENPESTASKPLSSTTSSPSSSTSTRATTTMATTTALTTTVPPSFEDTIIDGSKHGISFKPPGNEGKFFTMAMMYTDGKVEPNDPIRPYDFLVMTENDCKTIFYHYPGNDTSLEHLFIFHEENMGFKWDRAEPDAEIIIGKSMASEQFSNFDVRFTDKEIVIYAAPNYDQVLYVSEERWMNCAQPDCYPIRIGNPDDLDKIMYTFLVDAE